MAKCKSPNAEPTRKQTWAVFCMTGQDIRESKLTRGEVSNMISDLKDSGDHFLPKGKTYGDGEDFICTKANLKKTKDRLWDKETKPFTVKSVLKHKASKSAPRNDWAEDLHRGACAAGMKAMQELIDSNKVVPMVVQEHTNMLDDSSPVKQEWVVQGGACGFAWVKVKCSNGPSRKFINQLKKAGIAGGENSHCTWSKSSYHGGFLFWIHEGGQSMAYKEAYARGYSEVLEKEGINVFWQSRMD